jgi:hypothetical protein
MRRYNRIVSVATLKTLVEQLEVGETLRLGRSHMLEPQDLPSRYGRVVKAVDRLLQAMNCEAVVAGGWAVWRHGYVGRLTQDVDIVVPADRLDELLRVAAVWGFEVMPVAPGRWPKLVHKETGVTVDLLPEGQRPGTTSRPAPTTLPAPAAIGASGPILKYITFPALVELKLAAGRTRDQNDIIELIRANPDQLQTIRAHLAKVHPDYALSFDRLCQSARDEEDR